MPVFLMKAHPAPVISIIIPSRDGEAGGNVSRLITSLEGQERIDEAEIVLVVGERPNGHARNVGVDASRGRWLVFMDDDAVLHGTRILTALLAPLESAGAGDVLPIGMTGSSTMLPASANRFQRRVARALPRSVFPEVDQVTETDMAHHLCCALPRAIYEDIGRESDTLETGTDVDLRNRLRAAGQRIVVVPHTMAEHPPPATLRAFVRKQFWYGLGKVVLDRLHPPTGRNVIHGGRRAVVIYVVRALVTAPLRVLRHERAAPWQWNPLRALADLAQKLGYAWAYFRDLGGRKPTARLLSSTALAERLRPDRMVGAAAPRRGRVKRILIIASAGLGDALGMLPLLSAIRRHYSDAHITAWVSRRGAAEVIRRRDVVDQIVIRDLGARTFAGRLARKLSALLWLRRNRFDLALVNFINSTDEMAVLLYRARVPYRAGYRMDRWAPSLFNLVAPLPPVESGRQAVRRHLDLLAAIGVADPQDDRPHWPIDGDAAQTAHELLAQRGIDGSSPVVGLHPGCGADMSWKRWPAGRFAALADRLATDGAHILLFGGPDEHELVDEVHGAMRARGQVIRLCDASDLDLTAALMDRCDLVVANDSGLMNLALAVGAPVVAIFGPSPPEVSRPHPTEQPTVVIARPIPCRPCYDTRRPPGYLPCPIDRACLTEIHVDEVETACREVLSGRHVVERRTQSVRA